MSPLAEDYHHCRNKHQEDRDKADDINLGCMMFQKLRSEAGDNISENWENRKRENNGGNDHLIGKGLYKKGHTDEFEGCTHKDRPKLSKGDPHLATDLWQKKNKRQDKTRNIGVKEKIPISDTGYPTINEDRRQREAEDKQEKSENGPLQEGAKAHALVNTHEKAGNENHQKPRNLTGGDSLAQKERCQDRTEDIPEVIEGTEGSDIQFVKVCEEEKISQKDNDRVDNHRP